MEEIREELDITPFQLKMPYRFQNPIQSLWTGIKDRLQYTDLKESAAAYTEAPAEGVFSTYSRVSEDRPSATLGHLSALTRVAIHGPPPSNKDSHQLAEDALSHYKSKY